MYGVVHAKIVARSFLVLTLFDERVHVVVVDGVVQNDLDEITVWKNNVSRMMEE